MFDVSHVPGIPWHLSFFYIYIMVIMVHIPKVKLKYTDLELNCMTVKF